MAVSKEPKAWSLGYFNFNTAADATLLVTSDTVDLVTPSRSLYIGGAGTLKVTMAGGTTLTFTAVPAGVIMPLIVTRVWAIGTTATNIIALY